jgi:exportin-2 (importin alpha re-exporter)
VQHVLEQLKQQLGKICANPTNPSFSHFLFEAVATLVANVCQANPAAVVSFEAALFPPFQTVLQMDVDALSPYVFQVLAQLLELRPAAAGADAVTVVGGAYAALFQPLLAPTLYERRGNVPGLVRLLQAYLGKAAATPEVHGSIMPVLGVFQKLIASKSTEASAFELMRSIVMHYEYDQIQQGGYMPTVLQFMLQRLQSNKTAKFVTDFIFFCSVVICKHGTAALIEQMDSVQAGLFVQILQQVWVPSARKVETQVFPALAMGGLAGGTEHLKAPVKCAGIAMTRLLCDTPQLLAMNDGMAAWGATLKGLMEMLRQKQASETSNRIGAGGGAEGSADASHLEAVEEGYSAGFASLGHAKGRSHYDSLLAKCVSDAGMAPAAGGCSEQQVQMLLAKSLSQLSATRPGTIGGVVAQQLGQSPEAAELGQYFQAAQVALQ